MPMFSVKLGEIHLCADRAITDEERTRALSALSAQGFFICTSPDGLDVMGKPNVDTVRLIRRQP